MPKVCLRYEKVCPRYAVDMPTTYLRYAGTCIKYTQDMPKLCLRYGWNMPETCPRYSWDMQMICLRYYWDKPKICQKYALRCAKGMPKIHMLGMPNMYHDMPQTCPRHAEVCLRSQKDHWLRNSLSNTDPRDASASKMPSEMDVVPRHAMFHCLYLIF